MSQQSLTFLSQSASNLFKDQRMSGGIARFQPGVSGTMILKTQTHKDERRIAEEEKENEYYREDNRPQRLCEYHYSTSRASEAERIRLGVLDIPPKPIASIPGYSGFIPRKEAANVIGETYKNGNLHSAELFAQEQESGRRVKENERGPDPHLTTPSGNYSG